jgi:hypothetical protein
MGGWDNRPDPLRPSAERLQRSLRLIPAESGRYGPWGVLQRCDPDPDTGADLEVVPIDIDDIASIEHAIAGTTQQASQGSRTGPGLYIELARDALSSAPERGEATLKYSARVGFVDMRQPFNQVTLDVDDNTDDRALMNYMSALVQAWQPDYLGAVTREAKRAQGRKPPEVLVGRLTYIRAGTPLNLSALGDQIDAAAADGGQYIRIPGTPVQPSLDHIRLVRQALGYANA